MHALMRCPQTQKQATGTDLVINKTFWFALPGFVKEGCRFTWSKITRNDYQKL